jgi:hypothetical protein
MDVNDNACFLNKRVALESIASTLGSYKKPRSQPTAAQFGLYQNLTRGTQHEASKPTRHKRAARR